MNVPRLIVTLYPPAVRERWGRAMRHDIAQAGPRSWPNTATEAAKLWLHPSDWPERPAGQTHRVVAVALLAVTIAGGLLVRATAQPAEALDAGIGHPVALIWLALIAVSLLLAAPLPELRPAIILQLARAAARTLTAPALIVFAMWLTANSGVLDHPAAPVSDALAAWYWATLAFAGLRLCTLAARVVRLGRPPSTRRLQLALALIGAGLTTGACQSATAAATTPASLAAAGGLAALAAATLTAAIDIRRHARPRT